MRVTRSPCVSKGMHSEARATGHASAIGGSIIGFGCFVDARRVVFLFQRELVVRIVHLVLSMIVHHP